MKQFALTFGGFFVGVALAKLVGYIVARSHRAPKVKGLSATERQYEELLARSGVENLRRNPCNGNGCLIRLGTRCVGCGVTLHDCEVIDGCASCGSMAYEETFPVCDECSEGAGIPIRHKPPVCEPPAALVVER